jgi:hypothetical protein
METSSKAPFERLAQLLTERLDVIADHEWRERDAAGHLDRLKAVSEALVSEHERLRALGAMPPRLNHFLSQCSYSKALDWVRHAGAED